MAPSIDGRLDDPAWTTATHVTRFVQTRPAEGEPASEGTDVYIAYDSERLYFGFHAHYSDPRLIRANRVDRDHAAGDDTITVYFDTFLDQQRAYAFSVNGYGVSGDSLIRIDLRAGDAGGAADGNAPPGDTSWDALFSTAGQLVDDGWTAEMAIPLKSLRYPARAADEAHAWGFQIVRTIQSKGETVVWAPITRSVSGFMTQMGVLGGITRLSTSRTAVGRGAPLCGSINGSSISRSPSLCDTMRSERSTAAACRASSSRFSSPCGSAAVTSSTALASR